MCEKGVMAFGFELTRYIKRGDNLIEVRTDNDWIYKSPVLKSGYQWNNSNFNANYGGLPKNVRIHVCPSVYQTLPLYSSLGTTGVYVYGSDFNIQGKTATINVESQVKNTSSKSIYLACKVIIEDKDGKQIASFEGQKVSIAPGQDALLKASKALTGLHFWSWGYGYLYRVKTIVNNDTVTTMTGFRKTEYGKGLFRLNDRVMMVHGFAQRTSNEWPGVGISVPAWLSDYSNDLMVKSGGNLVRWMHVTPWKQDIESCDRVGLIQAMPAGDAEKDVEGPRWAQRTELMRDAIIYNRNNPSILFYECGNESISREHMQEMKAIRDMYDPNGGRAIGSREMLDIREAEYGGEMLYINKSKHHPMWAMEYCRDEGLRKYWDEYSYPYHINGDGNDSFRSAATNTVQKKVDARPYNRNQDSFTIENVMRWFDYWRERPGTGDRVSSGGVKIIFSDTNTHYRGVENYRRSGATDAMRIPKDPFFAHQVMWDGWVDIEKPRIDIVGHWNYKKDTVKPVYVISSAEKVELLLNGKSLGYGVKEYNFLNTFKDLHFEEGKLEAVGYDANGKECCRTMLQTAGKPEKIKLSLIQNPNGWKADGADMVLLQVEVTDKDGLRCPLANDTIHFQVDGPAEWRGGIAQGKDNFILSKDLPVECGVNRSLIRSLTVPGNVHITAKAEGLEQAVIDLTTSTVEVKGGLSKYIPGEALKGRLTRGETPLTPSYSDSKIDVKILSAVAGVNSDDAANSFDDNELSEWKNDGNLRTAWIKYTFERPARIDEICMKLTGWRMRSYPLEIYAGDEKIWSGETEKSLGYVHLNVKPVFTKEISIRLNGSSKENDAFNGIVEVAAPAAGELDLFKAKDGDKTNNELRIVEVEFKESLLQ